MVTLNKTKQVKKEQIIELSNQIITELQAIKSKLRNISPQNKKRALTAIAAFGAVLASIGAYKKYQHHKTGLQ